MFIGEFTVAMFGIENVIVGCTAEVSLLQLLFNLFTQHNMKDPTCYL